MSQSIPTNEPNTLRAGVTWQWRREDLSDYPASVWTLKYWFKRQGGTDKFSVTATADGDAFAVTHAADTSQTYVADDYTWVAVVTAGSEVFEVDKGTVKLLPRYNQDVALDDRSHAKKMLELVEAALEALQLGTKAYTIGTRTMTKRDLPELLTLRARYRAEVASELAAEQLASGGRGAARLQARL